MQPKLKQPEFNKKTSANTNKKKRRKKTHAGRPGAGNRPKSAPDVVHENLLKSCPECQRDLRTQPVIEKISRSVEDIPAFPEVDTFK